MLLYYLSCLDDDIDKMNFENIFYKYHQDIYRRIYPILRNTEDTEDAMQNTWICIFTHIEKFRNKDDGAIQAYILRIARNQAISFLREKKKTERTISNTELTESVDHSELFDLCEAEGVSAVLECIKMLSEEQRDVLNLYYFHHHSLKEIAKLLNLSEVAVASRWTRGRRKLIELLERRGYHG